MRQSSDSVLFYFFRKLQNLCLGSYLGTSTAFEYEITFSLFLLSSENLSKLVWWLTLSVHRRSKGCHQQIRMYLNNLGNYLCNKISKLETSCGNKKAHSPKYLLPGSLFPQLSRHSVMGRPLRPVWCVMWVREECDKLCSFLVMVLGRLFSNIIYGGKISEDHFYPLQSSCSRAYKHWTT